MSVVGYGNVDGGGTLELHSVCMPTNYLCICSRQLHSTLVRVKVLMAYPVQAVRAIFSCSGAFVAYQILTQSVFIDHHPSSTLSTNTTLLLLLAGLMDL